MAHWNSAIASGVVLHKRYLQRTFEVTLTTHEGLLSKWFARE